MGYQSIVYGRIVIKNNIIDAKEVIQSLGNQEFMFKSDMFGLGVPSFSYYENPIITFGATYKEIEDNLTDFIINFENILRQLDFDTAKIQLETEIMGTYNFFWKSKKNDTISFEENDKLIEVDEWFFGYGNRNRWGTLESDLLDEDIFSLNNFKYPIKNSNDC